MIAWFLVTDTNSSASPDQAVCPAICYPGTYSGFLAVCLHHYLGTRSCREDEMGRVCYMDICGGCNPASLPMATILKVDEHGKTQMYVLLMFLMRIWKRRHVNRALKDLPVVSGDPRQFNHIFMQQILIVYLQCDRYGNTTWALLTADSKNWKLGITEASLILAWRKRDSKKN